MLNNRSKQIKIETSFGRFSLMKEDKNAPHDVLANPMKIDYQPSSALSTATSACTLSLTKEAYGEGYDGAEAQSRPITKLLDYSRLAKLCNLPSSALVKRNLSDLAAHLGTMILGNNMDSEFTRGKLLRIDLKVGVLNVQNQQLRFTPTSLSQLEKESEEQ